MCILGQHMPQCTYGCHRITSGVSSLLHHLSSRPFRLSGLVTKQGLWESLYLLSHFASLACSCIYFKWANFFKFVPFLHLKCSSMTSWPEMILFRSLYLLYSCNQPLYGVREGVLLDSHTQRPTSLVFCVNFRLIWCSAQRNSIILIYICTTC